MKLSSNPQLIFSSSIDMMFIILSSIVFVIGTILNISIISYTLKKPWNQRTGIDYIITEKRIGIQIQSCLILSIFYMNNFKSHLNPIFNSIFITFCTVNSYNIITSFFLYWSFKYLYIVHGSLMFEFSNKLVRNTYMNTKFVLVVAFICIDQFYTNQITRNPLQWSLISNEKDW